MQIWYEGTDITGNVIPSACTHKDVSHGKADVLEIVFRRPAAWHRWQPETDDEIRVTSGKYDTGAMYVNTLLPEGEQYRMIATSLPSKAARKAWDNYREIELAAIVHRLAVECGMGSGIYGVEGTLKYPYLQRKNEGCAAFLERLCKMEGIALKAYNGAFRGIGIEYAQELPAGRAWTLDAEQDGVRYIHQPGMKYSAVTVKSPWAEATAKDADADKGSQIVIAGLPAMDAVTAGRWARGILLSHNRQADRLRISTQFDPGATAMTKAEISGNTGANGEWIIDEVEHDLYNGTTVVNLLRVISSVR